MTSSKTKVHDPSLIMPHAKKFFLPLYMLRSAKILERVSRVPEKPQIRNSERELCKCLLTRKECWKHSTPVYEKRKEFRNFISVSVM